MTETGTIEQDLRGMKGNHNAVQEEREAPCY